MSNARPDEKDVWAVLQELLDALDGTVSAEDSLAALFRYGEAEAAARALLERKQPALTDEREAFEKWANGHNASFQHWQFSLGSPIGSHCWAAWQARAVLASVAPPASLETDALQEK